MIAQSVLYQRKKDNASPKLSLVALMDIFTILVFFLLMNSGDSQNIETAKFVDLPDASSGKAPYADIKILVDDKSIYVDEVPIASVDEVLSAPNELIEPLQKFLKEHALKVGDLSGFEKDNGLALTIMGDKNVSYELIRAVMTTCQKENYRNISLAVNQAYVPVATASSDDAPVVGG